MRIKYGKDTGIRIEVDVPEYLPPGKPLQGNGQDGEKKRRLVVPGHQDKSDKSNSLKTLAGPRY